MIAKVLGFFDFLVVLVLLFSEMMPNSYLVKSSLYLLIKGGIFALSGDFASYIDVFCGVYILLFMLGLTVNFITAFVVLFLTQKFLLSMIF